jgi:hypothetical protein
MFRLNIAVPTPITSLHIRHSKCYLCLVHAWTLQHSPAQPMIPLPRAWRTGHDYRGLATRPALVKIMGDGTGPTAGNGAKQAQSVSSELGQGEHCGAQMHGEHQINLKRSWRTSNQPESIWTHSDWPLVFTPHPLKRQLQIHRQELLTCKDWKLIMDIKNIGAENIHTIILCSLQGISSEIQYSRKMGGPICRPGPIAGGALSQQGPDLDWRSINP